MVVLSPEGEQGFQEAHVEYPVSNQLVKLWPISLNFHQEIVFEELTAHPLFWQAWVAKVIMGFVTVVSVCAKYKDHAIALQKTRNAVLPLRTAVAKLAPSDIYITPIHAHLFQV
jgi:hypothetical protein